jgi:hypothetical protein
VLVLVVVLGSALAAPGLRLGLWADEPSTANVAQLGQPQEQPLSGIGFRCDRVFVYFPRSQNGLTNFPSRQARASR